MQKKNYVAFYSDAKELEFVGKDIMSIELLSQLVTGQIRNNVL